MNTRPRDIILAVVIGLPLAFLLVSAIGGAAETYGEWRMQQEHPAHDPN